MSMTTERNNLYSSHLSQPITEGMDWVMNKAVQRYPDDRLNVALLKSPELAVVLVGLTFAYSQIGAMQIFLELTEIGIRKLYKEAFQ